MEDDNERGMADAIRKTGGGLFSGTRILMIFLLIIGVIAGLFIQHQFVEPLLNQELTGGLNECLAAKKQLNQEIQQCYTDLHDANGSV